MTPWLRGRDRLTSCDAVGAGGREHLVAWCASCRCGTTQISPGQDYWTEAYPDEYFQGVLFVGTPGDKSGQLRAVERATETLVGRRVLEIGCSQGELLCLLRERGAHPMGVEASRIARSAAQERGLPVVERVEDLPDEEYDLVLLFDVLEHLPVPLETLQWIAKRLARSGRVVVAVPNAESLECRLLGARWFALELPRHLTHFSPHALERLARMAGLRCQRVDYSAASFLAKSFIDARLTDGWLKVSPLSIRRAAGLLFRWMEAGLAAAGNRPHFTMVLGRSG